ncbi:MAG: FkbM family methyltransferase [Deltaproteobacteria bacterium]|nr:FkbM family methyltransferase [Deltaproteobacteria bacterium]
MPWSDRQFRKARRLLMKLIPPSKLCLPVYLDAATKIYVPYTAVIYYHRQAYEPLTSKLWKERVANRKRTVFDIGSHNGYYSVLSALKEKGARIFAFEPLPEFAQIIETIALRNKFTTIKVQNEALSDKAGLSNFHRAESPNASSFYLSPQSPPTQSFPIETTTLDSFCTSNNIHDIDLIKIDVEGAEIEVLEGGRNVLSRSRTAELFIEFSPFNLGLSCRIPRALLQKIEDVGFRPVLFIDEMNGTIKPLNSSYVSGLETPGNLYCTKDPAAPDSK